MTRLIKGYDEGWKFVFEIVHFYIYIYIYIYETLFSGNVKLLISMSFLRFFHVCTMYKNSYVRNEHHSLLWHYHPCGRSSSSRITL